MHATTIPQPRAAGEAAHKVYDLTNSAYGWTLRRSVDVDGVKIWRNVATFNALDFEDAQQALCALNSHEALVGLLQEIADEVRVFPDSPRSYSGDSYLPFHLKEKLRAAVAKKGAS